MFFKDLRVYLWVPDKDVVFFQAILDATEGLARTRTERTSDHRSLLLLMTDESRRSEVYDFLHQVKDHYKIPLEFV